MKWILYLFCLTTSILASPDAWPTAANETVRHAKIYSLHSGEEPIFTQVSRFTVDPQGISHEETTIHDRAGNLVLTESSTFKGQDLISQHVQQLQTHKDFTVQKNGKHAIFTEQNLIGSPDKKTEEKDADETFLTGPVTEEFIRSHWDALMKGDTIHVRFGVLEISDTVGFKFFKIDSNSQEVHLRMKPSSIFIAMAVNPIDLTFDPKTRRMTHFKGRTPLRILHDGKLENFDGEIYYDSQ